MIVTRYSGPSFTEGVQSCSSFVCVGLLLVVTFEMVIVTNIRTNVLGLLSPRGGVPYKYLRDPANELY